MNALTKNGNHPLGLACRIHFAGEAIIPLLIRAGAKQDPNGDVLVEAFNRGGVYMRAISACIPPKKQLSNLIPHESCPDPIGSMREGIKYGFKRDPARFGRYLLAISDTPIPPEYLWSLL